MLIGGFAAVALRARIFPDEIVLAVAVVFGSALMALFVSMGLFACEREEGTLGLLLALPQKKWKVFAVKMGVGAVVCAGPVVLAIALMLLMAGGRELSIRQMILYGSSGMAAGLAAYVWMATFGVRQSSEAKAGLVAIAVVVGWILLIGLIPIMVKNRWLRGLLEVVSPIALVRLIQGAFLWRVVMPQLLVLTVLLFWGGWRFGKEGRVEK